MQLIIDDADAIETVQMVLVELKPQPAGDAQEQYRLKTVLLEQRGGGDKAKVPVIAVVTAHQQRRFVRLGAQFRVLDHQATIQALKLAGFEARASALTCV